MGCSMSKTLEQKLQKAGEEIAASVVDAAVDITVAAMKDASALGKEVVKDALEDAKEIVEKKMADLRDSIEDAIDVKQTVETEVASVVVSPPTIVLNLPTVAEEPVAPEEEKK